MVSPQPLVSSPSVNSRTVCRWRTDCSPLSTGILCGWEDNIKMDLQEVGGVCGDWMELAQDRDRWRALVSKVME